MKLSVGRVTDLEALFNLVAYARNRANCETDVRMSDALLEIEQYHQSRKAFDHKDVCGWTYLEHVETLLAEVKRLREALRHYGEHQDAGCLAGVHCLCGLDAAMKEERDDDTTP